MPSDAFLLRKRERERTLPFMEPLPPYLLLTSLSLYVPGVKEMATLSLQGFYECLSVVASRSS